MLKKYHVILDVTLGVFAVGCLLFAAQSNQPPSLVPDAAPVEPKVVRVAVPSVSQPSEITDHAPVGTAVLHAELDSISVEASATVLAFHLADWIVGRDARAQLALGDGKCSLEMIEGGDCRAADFFVRETDVELTLPFIEKPLIHVWKRMSGQNIRQTNELGEPSLTEIGLREFAIMLESHYFDHVPFKITTEHGAITSLEELYAP